MITARNYAAQAERSCYNRELLNNNINELKDAEHYKMLALGIKQAQHFATVDDGYILNDELKGLCNETWKLPFPIITIEYYINTKTSSKINSEFFTRIANKRLILAIQQENSIAVNSLYATEEGWIAFPAFITIPTKWWDVSNKDENLSNLTDILPDSELKGLMLACSSPFVTQPYNFKKLESLYGNTKTKQLLAYSLANEGRIVLELCEALTCKNVYTETLEPIDAKTNERRIKKGKIPFYETKILVVDSKAKNVDTTYYGGTHAPPRQHLRRGHIRRLASGNIWINNCVVGKSKNGIVAKDYAVC